MPALCLSLFERPATHFVALMRGHSAAGVQVRGAQRVTQIFSVNR